MVFKVIALLKPVITFHCIYRLMKGTDSDGIWDYIYDFDHIKQRNRLKYIMILNLPIILWNNFFMYFDPLFPKIILFQ